MDRYKEGSHAYFCFRKAEVDRTVISILCCVILHILSCPLQMFICGILEVFHYSFVADSADTKGITGCSRCLEQKVECFWKTVDAAVVSMFGFNVCMEIVCNS